MKTINQFFLDAVGIPIYFLGFIPLIGIPFVFFERKVLDKLRERNNR